MNEHRVDEPQPNAPEPDLSQPGTLRPEGPRRDEPRRDEPKAEDPLPEDPMPAEPKLAEPKPAESGSGEPQGVRPVRVLVVDDHPLFREGLKAALESAEGISVVAQAERIAEVPGAVERSAPDVVIMDLSLPDGSGLEALRTLSGREQAPPVLMLTMSDDDGNLLAALQAGARGYLVKGAGREEVLHAVRTVAAGGAVFGGEVAGRIAELLAGARMREAGQLFPELTAREAEVLDLVARGLDNRRIARELVVAEKTVRNHVTHIFEKLHVGTRAEAVARARDMGLGDG
ncbi:response regulator [Kitasatospora sp. NPDC059747]|uniref:response regulator n=1 Tax=Kitasatospora sp. NPDC059747 TaxID=3346930 RepID=UPI003659603D